jgi:hypothetical protein
VQPAIDDVTTTLLFMALLQAHHRVGGYECDVGPSADLRQPAARGRSRG